MYVLQTSLRLMADYTLLLAAYAWISQLEQLPRWSASRFCLSLYHLLACLLCVLSCCLQNCGLTHSPAAAGSIKGGFTIISDTIWTASFQVL